jgi:hypothetical protein
MRMNCEAVVSHSLPLPVGYGLPALSAAGLGEDSVDSDKKVGGNKISMGQWNL